MQQGYRYSEAQYFRFVREQYRPNEFEMEDAGDTRFVPGSHNAAVNGQRFHRMLRLLSSHIEALSDEAAVDIGFFPGTWINLCQYFWPEIRWHGVGLCISDSFRSWAEAAGISVEEADLDPFYARKGVVEPLPHTDASIDLVVASEIFEHLISPLPFLEESARVLKPGALLLLTTPNVSNIGSLIRLLRGESNHERLLRSPMFLREDEWRGHIRLYSKSELQWLAGRYGLEMIEHHYYHDDYPLHVLSRRGVGVVMQRLLRRAFGIVPWFRGGQLAMFRRKI